MQCEKHPFIHLLFLSTFTQHYCHSVNGSQLELTHIHISYITLQKNTNAFSSSQFLGNIFKNYQNSSMHVKL